MSFMHMLAKPTSCHSTLLAVGNTCKVRLKCISMQLFEGLYGEKGDFFFMCFFSP